MPALNLADPTYVRDQYRASDNLQARIVLHERFSTAKQKWFEWYWDHFDLPADARILEIGCGVGMLWRDNRAKIPAAWQLTLSDFSFGMVETCATHLRGVSHSQSDVQAIPFRNQSFDAVIANHMLYHVPDVTRAIAEMRRVLKPSGKFYTATNGERHLRELKTLVARFLGTATLPMLDENASRQFSLENGAAQLTEAFAHVARFDFDDALVVTEVEPLVAYIMSGFMGKQLLSTDHEKSLRQFITQQMNRDGAIRLTKSTGLYIAAN